MPQSANILSQPKPHLLLVLNISLQLSVHTRTLEPLIKIRITSEHTYCLQLLRRPLDFEISKYHQLPFFTSFWNHPAYLFHKQTDQRIIWPRPKPWSSFVKITYIPCDLESFSSLPIANHEYPAITTFLCDSIGMRQFILKIWTCEIDDMALIPSP